MFSLGQNLAERTEPKNTSFLSGFRLAFQFISLRRQPEVTQRLAVVLLILYFFGSYLHTVPLGHTVGNRRALLYIPEAALTPIGISPTPHQRGQPETAWV